MCIRDSTYTWCSAGRPPAPRAWRHHHSRWASRYSPARGSWSCLLYTSVERTEGKRWLHHPRVETFLAERVALFQRVYRLSLIHISWRPRRRYTARRPPWRPRRGPPQSGGSHPSVPQWPHTGPREPGPAGTSWAVSYTHLDVYKRQGHGHGAVPVHRVPCQEKAPV